MGKKVQLILNELEHEWSPTNSQVSFRLKCHVVWKDLLIFFIHAFISHLNFSESCACAFMHVYTGASQIRMSKAPGLRRRRTGLLPNGPKSSFQMRASFVFYLETKVLESGGRVEKLIAQVAWSPVLSFHSLWWFGVQCHLLVLVHCVFWKPTSLHPFTKTFWSTLLPSADQLFKDAGKILTKD